MRAPLRLLRPVVILVIAGRSLLPGTAAAAPSGTNNVTFNREVAPILFQQCAVCHRPGQAGPFALLSFADAKKHAAEIVRVTGRRYMPPWLPEAGFGDFAGERRLTPEQIGILQRWVEQGAVEGNPGDLPPLPKWQEGWHLGAPDLIVTLPEAYRLGAEGTDLYRNFVVPIPGETRRYVRAIEFHPGNKSVHHVRLLVDGTRQSRRLDRQDGEPGFGGMNPPASFPPGHLLTWTPGAVPSPEPPGLPWVLEPGTDLVLQIHMQRTGKPEELKPVTGIYFTNQPPSETAYLLGLISQVIDIPAGEKNHVVERSFVLPAAVQVISIMPHAHYLGKTVDGFATLPDGTRRWLIRIPDWDFNWQGQYHYATPVPLPKGATITMEISYDNSADNPRNPHRPPQRVGYGPQSTDEMGELWLQVVPVNPGDLSLLAKEYQRWGLAETVTFFENRLRTNPENAAAHNELGKALGPLGREEEAFQQFQTAARLDPALSEPHYYLGMMLLNQGRLPEASIEFTEAIRLRPDYGRAHDGLGLSMMGMGKPDVAETHFKEALRINPSDAIARAKLSELGEEKK